MRILNRQMDRPLAFFFFFCAGVGNFQEISLHNRLLKKKSCKESHDGKIDGVRAFCYPDSVFDFHKQFSHKRLPTKNNYPCPSKLLDPCSPVASPIFYTRHLTVSSSHILRSLFYSSGKRSGLQEMRLTFNILR